jgi:hypothetical protein
MNPVVGIDKDANIGAALEEESKLLGELVADGVSGLGVGAQERNPHDDPSMDGAVANSP